MSGNHAGLGFVVRIAWPGLDVVKDVVLAQAAITDDVDTFYETLGLCGCLLGFNLSGGGEDVVNPASKPKKKSQSARYECIGKFPQ